MRSLKHVAGLALAVPFVVPFVVAGSVLGAALPSAAASTATTATTTTTTAAAERTLANPVVHDGADPSVWYRDGLYYLVQSDGDRSIDIRASATIAGLGAATPQVVWTSPLGTDHSAETWAPEIEFLDGKWIIYFAADDGNNDNHRIFAITNTSSDPLAGGWSFFGKVSDSTDQWEIDPTVFFYDGSYWMLWSGTPTGNGGRAPQQIYIAHMSDPLHIDQDYRRLIANPDQPWETSVQAIEEGPEAWIGPDDTLTIVYNANASWTSSYSLGELVYHGGDLTQYTSYEKRGPVFSSANGLYGPGGESLPVPGAAGTYWNVFHADTDPNGGWAGRSIFAQPVPWNSDGTPDFGSPTGASYDEQAETPCTAPTVASLSSAKAGASGGAAIAVTGAAFFPDCTVTVDGAPAATAYVDARTLRFTAPAHSTGAADVAVRCGTATSAPATLSYIRDWVSTAVYTAGDEVAHDGGIYVAQWWTQDQAPGVSAYGPWAERGQTIECAAGATAAWTDSWISTGGEIVAHAGQRWRAQWWTRDQEPGASASGPWTSLGAC